MTKLAPWAAVVLFGAGVVSAQSLAEVAKKEKDRRARTGGDPVPVFGEDDLARSSGVNVSVMGRESDGEASEPAAEEEPAPERTLSEAEIRDYRETWRRVWAEQLEAAEKEYQAAEDAVFQCRSASHYFYVPLGIDCNGVYQRLAIAEYRLRETRQNRYNWELLLPERQRPPPSN